MHKFFSKAAAMLLSVLVAFSFLIVPQTDSIHADMMPREVKYAKTININLEPYKYFYDYYAIDMGKKLKGAKKVTVKVSNKAVVSDADFFYGDLVAFTVKKAGKTTLNIKVTKKNGSTSKYKVNVIVNKLKSPFVSAKLGKKNLIKQFRKDPYATVKCGKSAKLSIKPKKGWKVSKITYEYEYTSGDDYKYKTKKFTNNKKITFKNNPNYSEYLYFDMIQKSTGVKLNYIIRVK